jgi:hypothetical protein
VVIGLGKEKNKKKVGAPVNHLAFYYDPAVIYFSCRLSAAPARSLIFVVSLIYSRVKVYTSGKFLLRALNLVVELGGCGRPLLCFPSYRLNFD